MPGVYKLNKYFDSAFKSVVGIEGGYTNDKSDSGGETMYGITIRVARASSYAGAMRDLPLGLAKEIYYLKYWVTNKLDLIEDFEITEELFEQGVNMGTKRPALWLQENLNALNNRGKRWDDIVEDGKIGYQTLRQLNKCLLLKKGKARLLKLLNVCQAMFYRDLTRRREKDEKYLGGWLDNRVVMPEPKAVSDFRKIGFVA